MSQDQKARDDLFTAIKDLESHLATCTGKADYIETIVAGRESVTFALIDKCRESLLQLRQAKYVFEKILNRIRPTADQTGEETAENLQSLSVEINVVSEKASADMEIIVSWVPQAPNTRRFG